MGPPFLLKVGREAEELRVRAPLLHQLLVDLVAVGEAVDEPGLERFGAEERAAVDEGAHLGLRHLPALGDPLHQLPVDRLEKGLRRLPVGIGELRLRVLVHRVLELVPLAELGLDSELVEDAPQEGALSDEAVQAEVAGRLEPDLVEGGGEVVGAVPRRELAERLRVGDRELLLRPEGLHGVADLLDLGDADRRGAEARDETDDVRVVSRLLERVDDVAKRERPLASERGEGVVGRRLGNPALEVELEDRPLRDRRLPAAADENAGPDEDGAENRDDEYDDEKTFSALGHETLLAARLQSPADAGDYRPPLVRGAGITRAGGEAFERLGFRVLVLRTFARPARACETSRQNSRKTPRPKGGRMTCARWMTVPVTRPGPRPPRRRPGAGEGGEARRQTRRPEPGRDDEGLDGLHDPGRAARAPGEGRRELDDEDEVVDGPGPAAGRDDGHLRVPDGSRRPLPRAAVRGVDDGTAVLRHRLHRVRQREEEVRVVLDRHRGDRDDDHDRHPGQVGKEDRLHRFDARPDDREESRAPVGGHRDRRRQPPLRDVDVGSRREDGEVDGDDLYPEEVGGAGPFPAPLKGRSSPPRRRGTSSASSRRPSSAPLRLRRSRSRGGRGRIRARRGAGRRPRRAALSRYSRSCAPRPRPPASGCPRESDR